MKNSLFLIFSLLLLSVYPSVKKHFVTINTSHKEYSELYSAMTEKGFLTDDEFIQLEIQSKLYVEKEKSELSNNMTYSLFFSFMSFTWILFAVLLFHRNKNYVSMFIVLAFSVVVFVFL